MDWKQLISHKRLGKEDSHKTHAELRTEFQRDYDRLIFSAPFRRLQNKTQVFPLPGSIFVHNRLTHSLEVSSVGRSLGNDTARQLRKLHPEVPEGVFEPFGSIVSAACLAHDLGNPPFGHSGERAIISYFKEGNGARLQTYTAPDGDRLTPGQWNDLTHFDGNANTFRLLTHQFQGRRRGGFVMTYSTLAAIVKYPYTSSVAGSKAKFGFFESERESYLRIADELGISCKNPAPESLCYARHPLVYLVEAADDICYEIMDIEDAHKLRLLSDEQTMSLLFAFFNKEQCRHIERSFDEVTDINERIVYLRSCVINALEQKTDPGSTPGPLRTFCEQKLLDGVDELLDAALALSGLVLVDDALGSGLVEQAAGLVGGVLGGVDVLGLDGEADLLDGGLELGADRAVALTRLLSGDDALLLRLDVSHVQFLSVPYQS